MSSGLERLLPLVSMGIWPWSFAVIYLIVGLIRYRMSKAKPELILIAISLISIIVVGVLAHSSSSGGAQTTITTGDITQQGSQNAAGVGGTVTQKLEPCADPKAAKK